MPRGSRFLDEPTMYLHPEKEQQRTATTKVEAVALEADGWRKAADVYAEEDAADAVEQDAVEQDAVDAGEVAQARKAGRKTTPAKSVTADGAAAADATATETTEPNSGSGE